MISLLAGAGTVGIILAAVLWWLLADGPTRLCAGLVAVFHRNKTRRADARAVLAATKRRR